MRKFLLSVCTTLAFAASIIGASAQSSPSGFVTAPFAVNQSQFAAGITNINPSTFFGSVRINGGDGSTIAGMSLIPKSTNISSDINEAVLVLTGFLDSADPRTGSSGAVFQGLPSGTDVRTVSFQYAPLNVRTGLLTGDFSVAPALVIVDGPHGSRIRILPITSGLVATNDALNTFNKAFGVISSPVTGGTDSALDSGFLTVKFNPAQLAINGTVSKIGLVYARQGIVLVKAISINGAASTGLLTDISPVFPF